MKEFITFIIIMSVCIGGLWYLIRGGPCDEGNIYNQTLEYQTVCLNGVLVYVYRSEIEKAIYAKELAKEYDREFANKEDFCGKGNVKVNRYTNYYTLSCKDYTLVPDENLKQ